MKKYPKIREETAEAIEDLLDTFNVNLETLAKIGEQITSNIVIIDPLSSKLLSSLVRKWQHTLPDKRMPAYTHLMDFLQTRAHGDDIRPRSYKTKGSSCKSSHHRRHPPRGQAFHLTSQTVKFPACQGPHAITQCKIFKGKSATRRFELAKRASLCTNYLNKGHSLKQCQAGSCHTYGQRHHTTLHREHTQASSRIQGTRSSSDRSSSD
jgi:hypothetical protein